MKNKIKNSGSDELIKVVGGGGTETVGGRSRFGGGGGAGGTSALRRRCSPWIPATDRSDLESPPATNPSAPLLAPLPHRLSSANEQCSYRQQQQKTKDKTKNPIFRLKIFERFNFEHEMKTSALKTLKIKLPNVVTDALLTSIPSELTASINLAKPPCLCSHSTCRKNSFASSRLTSTCGCSKRPI